MFAIFNTVFFVPVECIKKLTERILRLLFSLMAVTNKPLELGL